MYLLARNEEINQWLEQNPAVLGAIFLLLGLALLAFGIKALLTGRSTGKYGAKFEGPMAYFHGTVMAIAGAGFSIFALFKLASAMF